MINLDILMILDVLRQPSFVTGRILKVEFSNYEYIILVILKGS